MATERKGTRGIVLGNDGEACGFQGFFSKSDVLEYNRAMYQS